MIKYLISVSLLLFCFTSGAFALMTKADIIINDSFSLNVFSANGRGIIGSLSISPLLYAGAE